MNPIKVYMRCDVPTHALIKIISDIQHIALSCSIHFDLYHKTMASSAND